MDYDERMMAALIVILAYCIIDEDNEDDTLLVERCHYNDLSEMSDRHFKDNFGLIRGEFEQIHEALQLPQPVRTVYKDVEDSRIALLMLLAYLRGRSVKGLESQFGWSAARVSRIRLEVGELLLEKWGQRLDPRQCGETLLCKQNLQRYAQSIYKQCHVDCIWGFIDGTLRPLARPIRYQEAVYNGWKHIHALKYQFVTTPDGLIFLQGPWDGAMHDFKVYQESGIQDWLDAASFTEGGESLSLFGDKGYPNDAHLMVPYKSFTPTADQLVFNKTMSQVRITVEWAIGSIPTLFPRLNNRPQQKSGVTPVGRDYLVAALIRNALSCLVGNTTSQFFGHDPPELHTYFDGA